MFVPARSDKQGTAHERFLRLETAHGNLVWPRGWPQAGCWSTALPRSLPIEIILQDEFCHVFPTEARPLQVVQFTRSSLLFPSCLVHWFTTCLSPSFNQQPASDHTYRGAVFLFDFGDVSVKVYGKLPVLPLLPDPGLLLSVICLPVPSLVACSFTAQVQQHKAPRWAHPYQLQKQRWIPIECTWHFYQSLPHQLWHSVH